MTTVTRLMATSREEIARNCPLCCIGISRGIISTDGMPAAMGMAAANPAAEADMPPVSSIRGSQLSNPWVMRNDRSAMVRRILTFRTLIRPRNTSMIPSSWEDSPLTLEKNHQRSPTRSTRRP